MAPVIVNLALDVGQRSPSRAGDFTIRYEPPNTWARSRCGRFEKEGISRLCRDSNPGLSGW